jgi:adenylate cyclase
VKIDYTTVARRIYLRHPLISDILTQINFWIFAYLLFFVLLHFIAKAVTTLYQYDVEVYLFENILVAMVSAVIFGTALGIIDFNIEKRLRGRSLGVEVLIKGALYIIAWFLVGYFANTLGIALNARFIDGDIITYTDLFAQNIFVASSLYTAFIIILIAFIKQMNNKFGPGILIPMFLGRFRKPRAENRIFLFMDLKDSTSYAEKLGSLKFSEMIQDCFLDVNRVLPQFNAEIYQYVGDEVVLSWQGEEGLKNMNCIRFFFSFQKKLADKKGYYENKYGFVPQFKAGANFGIITVAEVGDFKREIAYHGDTINTASRIQSVCNRYNQNFIISEVLKDELRSNGSYKFSLLEPIKLKGKEKEIKLYGVSEE